MKYKILTTLIASALLAGCYDYNEPNEATPSKSVQAFDGAIKGIKGKFECEGGVSGETGKTDDKGYVKVTNPTFVEHPETCSFTFVPTPGAVDTSNGKLMDKVSYTAPKGLFQKGQAATASPITTLITKQLDGKRYDESTATEVFEALGLDELANDSGIEITEFLRDTQASFEKIEDNPALKTLHSQVSAVTVALSDTLITNPDANADDIADVTTVATAVVLEQYPEYPAAKDKNGKEIEIFVDLTETLEKEGVFDKMKETAAKVETAEADGKSIEEVMKDAGLNEVVDKVNEPEIAKPIEPEKPEPEKPATGGTGATGGSGDAGGTGA